jgi:dATP pyrophosphohydrolase
MTTIPASVFGGGQLWAASLYVIPEYSFGVRVGAPDLSLSPEHSEFAWLPFGEAFGCLTFDSNRVALWELHLRINGIAPSDPRARWRFRE